MRFRVKTYFGESEQKEKKTTFILIYCFNLFYRSIIPMMLFYTIIEWSESPITVKYILWAILLFFVLYQFTWEAK